MIAELDEKVIRVFATAQTSGTTPMYVKCTDEVIA